MQIAIDKFNSEMFQMLMCNLEMSAGEFVSDDDLYEIEEEAKQKGIRHITVRVPSYDKRKLNTFLKNNYVVNDTLIEYFFDFKKEKNKNFENICIFRDAKESDLPIIKDIARNSYKIDRFHSDEALDNDMCDKYYEKWVENSVHGFAERVIVPEYNGKVCGFSTWKTYIDEGVGRLVLTAMDDSVRGLGIYTRMVAEGVKWIQKEYSNLKGVMAGTQLDNIPSQRAWIRVGFSVCNSMYVLSKCI